MKKPLVPRQSRNTSDDDQFLKSNLRIVTIGVLVFALAIIVTLIRWQIIEHDKWTQAGRSQYIEKERQASGRGTIYASDGTILAIDEPAWGIYASLSSDDRERKEFFNNKDIYVSEVSAILGIAAEDVNKLLKEDFRYIPIAHGVASEKKNALEKLKVSESMPAGFGLYFEKEEKRVYPDGKLASHVLGFMGKDPEGKDVGMYGIEGYYFGDLQSQNSASYSEKDSEGNVILTSNYEPLPSRQGKSITLTIKPGIQTKVEKVLKKQVELTQSISGVAIVMEPTTGAIIAMAGYPNYDPNEYWKAPENRIYTNMSVATPYEFGSVQKPITIAIGIESGKIKMDYKCNDRKGYIEFPDGPNKTIKIYTWNRRANGLLSLAGILEKSNNPCAAQVALDTGFDYYYEKLKEFGYGKLVGMGLQEENSSDLKPHDEWSKIDFATAAFGQTITATPIQIISALNTIANDGQRLKPYIVQEIQDENGEKITYQKQVLANPISKDTADKVTKLMISMVRNGETKAYFNQGLPGYDIAGKTGTAQIPKKNSAGYENNKTNTTFVGFSPTAHPKMIMLVKLEEPKNSTYSSSTVVPAWIDIYKAIADDLGISKTSR